MTPKHVRFSLPLNELKAENDQLKTLVLEQQIELKRQFKQSSSPPRKSFHLNEFLNSECGEALDWHDFVGTFGVGLEACDITTRIANVLIDAAKRSGVHKRSLHCLDVKRKKMCVKLKGQWVQNDDVVEPAIQDAVLQVQSTFLQKTRQWQIEHPDWANRESETTEFVELVQRISAPIDFSRFYSLVMPTVTIPKA